MLLSVDSFADATHLRGSVSGNVRGLAGLGGRRGDGGDRAAGLRSRDSVAGRNSRGGGDRRVGHGRGGLLAGVVAGAVVGLLTVAGAVVRGRNGGGEESGSNEGTHFD